MAVEAAVAESNAAGDAPPTSVYPEVEIFINTLVLTTLQRYHLHADAALASALLVQRCGSFNRRSLDVISSKAYFYFSLAFENMGRLGEIRPTLLKVCVSMWCLFVCPCVCICVYVVVLLFCCCVWGCSRRTLTTQRWPFETTPPPPCPPCPCPCPCP